MILLQIKVRSQWKAFNGELKSWRISKLGMLVEINGLRELELSNGTMNLLPLINITFFQSHLR